MNSQDILENSTSKIKKNQVCIQNTQNKIEESSPIKTKNIQNEKKLNELEIELTSTKELLQEEREKNLDLENQFINQKTRYITLENNYKDSIDQQNILTAKINEQSKNLIYNENGKLVNVEDYTDIIQKSMDLMSENELNKKQLIYMSSQVNDIDKTDRDTKIFKKEIDQLNSLLIEKDMTINNLNTFKDDIQKKTKSLETQISSCFSYIKNSENKDVNTDWCVITENSEGFKFFEEVLQSMKNKLVSVDFSNYTMIKENKDLKDKIKQIVKNDSQKHLDNPYSTINSARNHTRDSDNTSDNMKLKKKVSEEFGFSSILNDNMEEKFEKMKKNSESLKNIVVYMGGIFDTFEAQFTAYEMQLVMSENYTKDSKEFLQGIGKTLIDIKRMKGCSKYKELIK